jgi:hypothetical protein
VLWRCPSRFGKLAVRHDLYVEVQQSAGTERQTHARERERIFAERAKKLGDLKASFCDALTNPNRQSAGYFLEELLYELFSLFGIDYRKPYETETEQIDGHIPLRRI